MKASIKRILAASALAAAAAAPAFAYDTATTGNGSLVVTVFDTNRGVSVFQDLGINYLDFLNSPLSRGGVAGTDVTPDAGLTLGFNVDMSIFAGSDPANIRWNVFALDGQGNFGATEVLVTANPTLGTISGTTNGELVSLQGAYEGHIGTCTNGGMPSVCTGQVAPPAGNYLGGTNWGENLQYLGVSASAEVGQTLGFYGVGRSSIGATANSVSYQYGNANGIATWLLDAAGNLTWNAPGGTPVVPLPAAAWLLLSGLAGLGVIGRRRKDNAAA